MALPFSRNTTYSPGSPIYSVDLNALQDAIIGAKRGPVEHPISRDQLSGGVWQHGITLASALDFVPVPLWVGNTLTSCYAVIQPGGTAVYRLELWQATDFPSASAVLIASSANTSGTTRQKMSIAQAAINANAGLVGNANAAVVMVAAIQSGSGSSTIFRYSYTDSRS